MQTEKPLRSIALSVILSFNVAAICALGAWHAYVSCPDRAMQQQPRSPLINLYQIDRAGNTATPIKTIS